MNNLAQRLITGIIGVTVMVVAIVNSATSFFFLFLALLIVTLAEFYSLTSKNGYHPFIKWALAFSISLFVLAHLSLSGAIDAKFLWLLLPFFTLGFILPLYAKKEAHPINCLAITLMGILYIAVPFTLLNAIAYVGGYYEFQIVLGLLLAQWAADTGAYFAGKAFGKTKLFERISPKKTWEGTIGGIALALGVLYFWSIYFDSLTTFEWLGLGLIVSVFGSFGDLVESLFKRTFDLKDSGTVLAGHGGFLDRFDGLIIAIPFATVYIMFII